MLTHTLSHSNSSKAENHQRSLKAYYSAELLVPLPGAQHFPMPRYSRLYERVLQVRNAGIELCTSLPAAREQVLLVHTQEYFEKVAQGELTEKEIRRIGLPWSPALFTRSLAAAGCTIAACHAAISDGIAANLAGGSHHAHSDHGEGYCIFNDVAVAARVMLDEKKVSRVLVLDCDVHQGNGTAMIFAEDPGVFTFSIHGQKNFPYHKEQGDLDIALPDGSTDQDFLLAIASNVPEVVDKFRPDLVIYIAGADPFFDDRLGRMSMTKAGLAERDRWVLDYCHRCSFPAAVVMGGGYARQIDDVVDIHLQTILVAAKIDQLPETDV
jgi:acetoin utilization deacetylase AcuC-like enzyme